MDKKIAVSIILPSFNVARYIRECIESVIKQSLQDIEIICVDAGSIDGTLEILQEYESMEERVRIIISEKKSYGYQMNLGIQAAKGEYIGIVDTDDYVPKEMFDELYCIAKSNRLDFVKADFYRFTGTGDNLKKILCRLSEDCSFYNRIINIEKEQKCFYFVMNTWSGIYNRDFLLKYEISHNESPGASFQDNGFWFQTFMYAKRAFFVNKPYYMNRRDNPNSSVYDKNKVFCVCDEYEFIGNILKKDRSKFQRFKYVYTSVYFQVCKGNLSRIADKYKEVFLERVSEEFYRFQKQGMVDRSMFNERDWKIFVSIAQDAKAFFEEYILPKIDLFDKIHGYEKVIIYGAGMVGKQLLYELKYNHISIEKFCFAVTQKDGFSAYQGIPIYDIHDLVGHREKCLVIIATTKLYQLEIYNVLKQLGFLHIIRILDWEKIWWDRL